MSVNRFARPDAGLSSFKGKIIINSVNKQPVPPNKNDIILYNENGSLKVMDDTKLITQLLPMASGSGDVFSIHETTTENSLLRMNGTTGKSIKHCTGVLVDDCNNLTILGYCESNVFDSHRDSTLHIGVNNTNRINIGKFDLPINIKGNVKIKNDTVIGGDLNVSKNINTKGIKSDGKFNVTGHSGINIDVNGGDSKIVTDNLLVKTIKDSLNIESIADINLKSKNFNISSNDINLITEGNSSQIIIGHNINLYTDEDIDIKSKNLSIYSHDINLKGHIYINDDIMISESELYVSNAIKVYNDDFNIETGYLQIKSGKLNIKTNDTNISSIFDINLNSNNSINLKVSQQDSINSIKIDRLGIQTNSNRIGLISDKVSILSRGGCYIYSEDNISITSKDNISIKSEDNILIRSDCHLNLNANGLINIGTDNYNQNINIGINGKRTLNIGNKESQIKLLGKTIELNTSKLNISYIKLSQFNEIKLHKNKNILVETNGDLNLYASNGNINITGGLVDNNIECIKNSSKAISLNTLSSYLIYDERVFFKNIDIKGGKHGQIKIIGIIYENIEPYEIIINYTYKLNKNRMTIMLQYIDKYGWIKIN